MHPQKLGTRTAAGLAAALALATTTAQAQQPMDKMPGMAAAQPGTAQPASATGLVKAVDAAAGKVTLSHGPIKAFHWPPMTMTFQVRDKALFDRLVVGKTVDFDVVHEGGAYIVTAVH
ncbi:MAG: copper-binding protein [Burkholderiales bacterium]|nr:copper-binding protein [Burkholderiales bacterium]MDE2275866.1 copper-binding protein [Burkholderiales bacterium]